ncbi:organic hydroperoxide reductase OsmC/OhrA [Acinetobacter calcoaceticus]|uniref:Organic hydroperoxide reductase OsmC/OhrA n=1 Tax=Acinetobacter calcoaceticus TaxID=471 RepID=A0A4R1Y6B1_ACICA|nr:organic hydroperoxide reductase OsmC/OhrA [Acinetobacter calcoaceticus]
MALHQYQVEVHWEGNTGTGTSSYQAYKRDFLIKNPQKSSIAGSADPAYLGDMTRWNPEDLIVAAVSSCHQLWYLHLCAVNQIQVLSYVDHAVGYMQDNDPIKRGHMTEIKLRPQVTLSQNSDVNLAAALHEQAHHECMIANSVNFPIHCEANFIIVAA